MLERNRVLNKRNHIFHELTRSLCPECGRVIDSQVLLRDGAVYLRKRCPEHGWREALVMSDADWYLDSLKYNKPGAVPYDFATEVDRGCPLDCGLCPEHQQHTCVAVVEITERCNLACPTCFADAGAGRDLSVAQVEAMLDRLLETEGRPEVVQISGGEPTVHPRLFDILAAAKARDIRHVMLNTNGLRLAQEPDFARRLAEYQPTIYLQFDGLRAATYQALRGRDLRDIKKQALDRLAEAGLYAVLVATLTQGLNEDEIGGILRYGLDHPAVLGVCYQPVTFAGRCLSDQDPLHRLTLPDVLHALEAQTGGLFRPDDFRPVPCPHPTCSASSYAIVQNGDVTPITRLLDVDDYLDFVANRTVPDLSDELQPVLEALWSMAAVMGSDDTTDNLTCAACDLSLPLSAVRSLGPENFFLVHVHAFMDAHTFDLRRIMKCCIHELLPDGRAVPFCAYNNVGCRGVGNW
ncbi:MAG TPA: radical SAM protein [Anaerolineae bacterium]|nr:radical SAM protein [Anaerolineae bacterium]